MPSDDEVEFAAERAAPPRDKNRIKIWGACCRRDLRQLPADLVQASPSVVSQHLAKLRLAGSSPYVVRARSPYAAADSHVQRCCEKYSTMQTMRRTTSRTTRATGTHQGTTRR